MKKAIFLSLIVLSLLGCARKNEFIPDSIGRLKLHRAYTGAEAKRVINQLHGKEIAGEKNEVGIYKADTLKATLYVSKFKNINDARKIFEQMVLKIAEGKSPFVLHNQIMFRDKAVILAFGMGQAHYFYPDSDKVVWLAVDIPIAMEAIHSLLNLTKSF